MRALFLGVFLALAGPAAAVEPYPRDWKPIYVDKFGGLNLLSDSANIDGDCQTCQNVLTDSGYLEKRPGSILLKTILAGYIVQYVNDWISPSGTRYLIAESSSTIWQTNFSGSPVSITTVATGYTLNTAAAFSNIYFADGARNLFFWNGTSSGTVSDATSGVLAPVCTYIATKDARMFCANIPSEGTSRVRISSSGGAGYWAVSSNAATIDNTANVFDLNPNDGDSIYCMATTPWGVFVGKRYSSYMIKGNGNLTYEGRILDPRIGCVDNRSVQMVYGVLHWLAVDGVYAYDGRGPPQLISRELDPLMKQVRESIYSDGQWATQLQSDWNTGAVTASTNSLPSQGAWDFNSVPGEIFPSSFTISDDNTNAGLQVGIGFGSDTLINIDTITFPLNTGYSQISPSTAGIMTWYNLFPSASLTSEISTWTISAGSFGSVLDTGGGVAGASFPGLSTMYTVYGSSLAPTPINGNPPAANSGWIMGSWTMDWRTYNSGCTGSVKCFQLNFLNTKQPGLEPNAYYGLVVVNANNCTSPSTNCDFTISLVKKPAGTASVPGTETTLAQTTQHFDPNGNNMEFEVVRVQNGTIYVYLNNVFILSGYDSDATLADNDAVSVTLGYWYVNGQNIVSSITARGFGTGTLLSRIYDTNMATPFDGSPIIKYNTPGVTGETAITFNVRSTTSPNNDVWSSWQASSNTQTATITGRYQQYEALLSTIISSKTPTFTSISLPVITTGYYYSKVNYIGTQITSWKQLNVSENTQGTYAYAIRAASYSFSGASTNTVPSWTNQTVNQNITIATGSYVQFRLDSTSLVTASTAEPITAVFVRWANGANIPVASDTLDRRYFLCVAISTSATVPDTCLIRQKNGKWVYYKGSAVASMGLYNYNMVVGVGDTSSNVIEIMQPGVYKDTGTAIDAQWVSGDFVDGTPFNKKILHEIWIDALPVQASSVTVSYAVDKSSGWNDTLVSLDNGQSINPSVNFNTTLGQYGTINKQIVPASGYDTGKYIRVKFEDNTIDSYYRINDYMLYIENQGRQVP